MPAFCSDQYCLIFSFLRSVLWIIVRLFVIFLLVIILSVLLRITWQNIKSKIGAESLTRSMWSNTSVHNIWISSCKNIYEGFKNTKGVLRCRNSKKDRQYNDQKKNDKKTNNDPQNTAQRGSFVLLFLILLKIITYFFLNYKKHFAIRKHLI
jgi:hypothetical protein